MDLLRAVVLCTPSHRWPVPSAVVTLRSTTDWNSPLIDLRVGALGLVCGVGGVRRVCGRGPVFRGKGAVGAGQPISPSVPEHPARPSASAAPSPPRYRHRVVRFSLVIADHAPVDRVGAGRVHETGGCRAGRLRTPSSFLFRHELEFGLRLYRKLSAVSVVENAWVHYTTDRVGTLRSHLSVPTTTDHLSTGRASKTGARTRSRGALPPWSVL